MRPNVFVYVYSITIKEIQGFVIAIMANIEYISVRHRASHLVLETPMK